MADPDRTDAENNEVRWWSKWARLRWHGQGYLLTSESFREPFFNRGGSLTCEAAPMVSSWAERTLARQGSDATFLIFDSCAVAHKKLFDLGYAEVDTMSVLVSEAPIEAQPIDGRRVEPATSPETWTRAYLRAFYGDEDLSDVVTPIVTRLLGSRGVTLFESRVKGETAGVLALFRTHGIGGVYCVGTVPEFRSMGIATGLLAKAREAAEGERRKLVLQSLASDGSMALYMKRGFEVMYSKHVLERKLKSRFRKRL